jgi:hypothetical protein
MIYADPSFLSFYAWDDNTAAAAKALADQTASVASVHSWQR